MNNTANTRTRTPGRQQYQTSQKDEHEQLDSMNNPDLFYVLLRLLFVGRFNPHDLTLPCEDNPHTLGKHRHPHLALDSPTSDADSFLHRGEWDTTTDQRCHPAS